MNKKKEKIEYDPISFRLSKDVLKELRAIRGEQSWNLFFKKLINLFNKYE